MHLDSYTVAHIPLRHLISLFLSSSNAFKAMQTSLLLFLYTVFVTFMPLLPALKRYPRSACLTGLPETVTFQCRNLEQRPSLVSDLAIVYPSHLLPSRTVFLASEGGKALQRTYRIGRRLWGLCRRLRGGGSGCLGWPA